jgi:hypothetical protein
VWGGDHALIKKLSPVISLLRIFEVHLKDKTVNNKNIETHPKLPFV